ncbi:hypothetical protein BCH308197_B0046 (plasmid) [Bacillus cereus H3081.97]|nr:hypothetical protein BCH308197_B0046 [Bacillus cereus H3081.97]AEA19312.1 hypothetical protein CT43_P127130 [Bacillus thuringiensis serovar chinensis CT-43]AGG04836.1 hypothetical protein H175_107p112 [Bacillus thuringiensis serovar thuringiensis str. IS5056]AHZ55244.1 hypothetical protein YBT1520_33241 [Bacillus thuringiensis serovar kurstaki str. YBT-1520]AIE37185.1 hypothetical protein BTK_33306 [Bacillus thuringiensis serovar kurstaki str. HD-1]AKR38710.1 Hypothetical protein NF53_p4062
MDLGKVDKFDLVVISMISLYMVLRTINFFLGRDTDELEI